MRREAVFRPAEVQIIVGVPGSGAKGRLAPCAVLLRCGCAAVVFPSFLSNPAVSWGEQKCAALRLAAQRILNS